MGRLLKEYYDRAEELGGLSAPEYLEKFARAWEKIEPLYKNKAFANKK